MVQIRTPEGDVEDSSDGFTSLRRLPLATPFNQLEEVYTYLRLVRPSTRLDVGSFDNHPLHLCLAPLPYTLHRIVLDYWNLME